MKDADAAVHDIKDAMDARINIRDFVVHAMGEFGGPEGLATEFALCFQGTKQGSQVRVRMLSDFLGVMRHCTDDEGDDLPDDPEQLEATIRGAHRSNSPNSGDASETAKAEEQDG